MTFGKLCIQIARLMPYRGHRRIILSVNLGKVWRCIYAVFDCLNISVCIVDGTTGEVPVRIRTHIVDDTAVGAFFWQCRPDSGLLCLREGAFYRGFEVVKIVPLSSSEFIAYRIFASCFQGVQGTVPNSVPYVRVLRVVVRVDTARDVLRAGPEPAVRGPVQRQLPRGRLVAETPAFVFGLFE
ncbi:hypothetical protein SAMN05216226_106106 [Halovenus aranensis]|uniref:Uncharacterized protein n=1 Tax=Halovenus aranensis TaxID=890420 RepID=A0A1G8VB89_9EURY|nr:hypothetical protein SAMN05216226_106106 [Halovenus aranensis]